MKKCKMIDTHKVSNMKKLRKIKKLWFKTKNQLKNYQIHRY